MSTEPTPIVVPGAALSLEIVVLAHAAALGSPYAAQVADAIKVDGTFPLHAAKVYDHMNRLQKQGYFTAAVDAVKEFGGRLLIRFTITEAGKARLRHERSRVLRLADIIDISIPE
jgi:DNA-binding PadR family transcriptional regulator